MIGMIIQRMQRIQQIMLNEIHGAQRRIQKETSDNTHETQDEHKQKDITHDNAKDAEEKAEEAVHQLAAAGNAAAEFVEDTIQVYYNGVLQIQGGSDDYTEDSDKRGITFALAPEAGSKVVVIYSEAA